MSASIENTKNSKGFIMTDERCFRNPYPKYNNEVKNDVVDITTGKFTAKFEGKIRTSLTKLLQILERNLKQELDWHDTSIYTGVTGYIYMYLHLSEVLKDDEYFTKAIPLAEKVLGKLKGKRESFLCGDGGPLALCAIIYHKLGEAEKVKDCIKKLIDLKENSLNPESGLPDEILYGRIGYMYALLFVKQKIPDSGIEEQLFRDIILEIFESGKRLTMKHFPNSPLMFEWNDKCYLGAAHGIMGIMFILLQIKEKLSSEELVYLLKPTIDWVLSLRYRSGNIPSSLGSNSDRLVHWCHGAPGGIFLYLLAYKVYGDPRYMEQAQMCADVVWERGLLKKGYGICHGAAGNGYSLLYFYQLTGDTSYLYEAGRFAEWCMAYGTHGCRNADRPMSLFEGLAGTIYFLSDLLQPDEAKFPAFVL